MVRPVRARLALRAAPRRARTPASIPESIALPRAARLILFAPALLGGCGADALRQGVLDPRGPVAAGEKLILTNSLAIMLAIVVPTILATLAFAWWFREGNARAKYLPDFEYSGKIELLVWSIPVMVVLFLGGIAWVGSHLLDPYRPLDDRRSALEVEVVSLDWKWLFIYPGQNVASVNRLVLPAGVPVHFRITSATVMNSFFVPQLGGQIYAMSGMEAQLHLKADRPGRFMGISAHYSGQGFSDMRFDTDALPPAAFAAWVRQARASPLQLDPATYQRLSARGTAPALTFRAVEPRLFRAIVAGTAPTTDKPPAAPNVAEAEAEGAR